MLKSYHPSGWTRATAILECKKRGSFLGAIETDKIANAIINSLSELEVENYSLLTGEIYNKYVSSVFTFYSTKLTHQNLKFFG